MKNQRISSLCFWFLLFLTPMTQARMSESARVQSHLKLVESLLRLQDTSNLSEVQRTHRQQSLDQLRSYWQRGLFPINTGHPGRRQPYFIDDRGVPCAVAHLIIESGNRELAESISKTQNFSYLEQIENQDLQNWVEQSGFSLDELRLIQPSYQYQPISQDAFIEASYLGDIEVVQRILSKNLLAPETKQRRLNEALRIVVPVATAGQEAAKKDSEEDDENDRSMGPGIYYEPPPFKGHGREVILALLKAGADPNDRSDHRPSIASLAKNAETETLLQAHGGKLNQHELLIHAIDTKDVKRVEEFLKKPGFAAYSSEPQMEGPLAHAISKAIQVPEEGFVPLTEMKTPEMKVVSVLMKHAPKVIRLTEPGLFELILRSMKWNLMEAYLKTKPALTSGQRAALLEGYLSAKFGRNHEASSLAVKFFNKARSSFFEGILKVGIPYEESFVRRLVEDYAAHPNIEALIYCQSLGEKVKPSLGPAMHANPSLSALPDAKKRLEILLGMGADVNQVYGSSFVFQPVIDQKDERLLAFMIQKGAWIDGTKSPTVCPPLAVSILTRDIDTTRLLLKLGAKPTVDVKEALTDCKYKVPGMNVEAPAEKGKKDWQVKSLPTTPQIKKLLGN
jgi:hypothetical protein